MRSVRLLPSATNDLMLVYAKYRERDEPELADRVLHESKLAFDRLKLTAHAYQPTAHTPAGRPIRRTPFKTLPYMFVYIIDRDDVVQIFACLHVKQNQAWRFREP